MPVIRKKTTEKTESNVTVNQSATAAATAKVAAQRASFMVSSMDAGLEQIIVNLYGQPKAGKTWCSLSLSDKWPGIDAVLKRGKADEWLHLDDLLVFQWEPGCHAGLLPYKINVPYVIDVKGACAQHGFDLGWRKAVLEGLKFLKEMPGIKAVIHDTVSAADTQSLAWHEHPSRIPLSKRTGEPDTQAIFGRHLAFHRQYATTVTEIPPNIVSVFLFHEKVLDEQAMQRIGTEAAKAQFDQKKLGAYDVCVVPAITGNGDRYYTYPATLEAALIAKEQIKGKERSIERKLYPVAGDEGRRAKNRFEHILTTPVVPELRVILDQLHAALKHTK